MSLSKVYKYFTKYHFLLSYRACNLMTFGSQKHSQNEVSKRYICKIKCSYSHAVGIFHFSNPVSISHQTLKEWI